MIWLHNKKGEYLVRSGYHLARQVLKKADWAESSNRSGRQQLWSTLWKLKIPGKIKIFGWRACHDILPTWMSLAKRKVVPKSLCHCCQREPEDAVHAIWGCGVAQDVWAGSLTVLQKIRTNHCDFLQLVELLADRLDAIKLELFFIQSWLIWDQRNVVVHGGHLKDPRWLNKRAAELLDEYKKAQARMVISNAIPRCRSYWQPLTQDVYKLNFDAAVFSDMNCSGVGAIVRNHVGEVMAAMLAKGEYVHNSDEAEVLACHKALEFAMEAGFSNLVIEGDNSNVMRALSASTINNSLYGHVVDDIRSYFLG